MNEVASAILCEHANECPSLCPCKPGCYCKTHSCRGTTYHYRTDDPTGWPQRDDGQPIAWGAEIGAPERGGGIRIDVAADGSIRLITKCASTRGASIITLNVINLHGESASWLAKACCDAMAASHQMPPRGGR